MLLDYIDLHVSRETLSDLQLYANTLTQWNARINLVAPSTITDTWRRHIVDSAQLSAYIPPSTKTIADIGSGAGFPGLVLGIIHNIDVYLIESDQRKCIFMNDIIRQTGRTNIHVINDRVENISGMRVDVVTSRACAPLQKLLCYSDYLLKPEGICLLLKGEKIHDEIAVAGDWNFDYSLHESAIDTGGAIIEVRHLEKKGE